MNLMYIVYRYVLTVVWQHPGIAWIWGASRTVYVIEVWMTFLCITMCLAGFLAVVSYCMLHPAVLMMGLLKLPRALPAFFELASERVLSKISAELMTTVGPSTGVAFFPTLGAPAPSPIGLPSNAGVNDSNATDSATQG